MFESESLHAELASWRQDLHAHPEFGFEETRTAALVAGKLRSFGLDDVTIGVGGTGVVGTLKRGGSNRSLALRADMDALRITEVNRQDYCSKTPGLMHACGHDGHTVMLLGAARKLAQEGGFDGTIRFIFQPAEEWGKGASAMIADGLMTRFPFDEIFGLHNMPGMPVGRFETRAGPFMSAEDNFEIVLTGKGGHAARPHVSNETLVAACALVTSLQTIVSRRLSPADIAVVSVTNLETDGTRNVLPGKATINGDARSFHPQVSAMIERQMRAIAEGIAIAYNLEVSVHYTREFVPLVNDPLLADEALEAAKQALGPGNAGVYPEPFTASEDFARFLEHVPGCFGFLGNGENSAPLHNPTFDFNDDIIMPGVELFAAFARRRLPLSDV